MAKPHKIVGTLPTGSYQENARIILPQKVEEVYTWEPFIRDETRSAELHNMRIAVKRLRYTMELFQDVYRTPTEPDSSRFTEYLAVVRDLQEILGDIHDGDVVLAALAAYTSQLGEPVAPAGVQTLSARTAAARRADYAAFLKKWDHLASTGFKQKLVSLLGTD